MVFDIRIKPSAEKELNRIPASYRERIVRALSSLADDPFQGKKLKGEFREYWSLRVWPYRIIYAIYNRELLVIVVRVAHRQGAY